MMHAVGSNCRVQHVRNWIAGAHSRAYHIDRRRMRSMATLAHVLLWERVALRALEFRLTCFDCSSTDLCTHTNWAPPVNYLYLPYYCLESCERMCVRLCAYRPCALEWGERKTKNYLTQFFFHNSFFANIHLIEASREFLIVFFFFCFVLPSLQRFNAPGEVQVCVGGMWLRSPTLLSKSHLCAFKGNWMRFVWEHVCVSECRRVCELSVCGRTLFHTKRYVSPAAPALACTLCAAYVRESDTVLSRTMENAFGEKRTESASEQANMRKKCFHIRGQNLINDLMFCLDLRLKYKIVVSRMHGRPVCPSSG